MHLRAFGQHLKLALGTCNSTRWQVWQTKRWEGKMRTKGVVEHVVSEFQHCPHSGSHKCVSQSGSHKCVSQSGFHKCVSQSVSQSVSPKVVFTSVSLKVLLKSVSLKVVFTSVSLKVTSMNSASDKLKLPQFPKCIFSKKACFFQGESSI